MRSIARLIAVAAVTVFVAAPAIAGHDRERQNNIVETASAAGRGCVKTLLQL